MSSCEDLVQRLHAGACDNVGRRANIFFGQDAVPACLQAGKPGGPGACELVQDPFAKDRDILDQLLQELYRLLGLVDPGLPVRRLDVETGGQHPGGAGHEMSDAGVLLVFFGVRAQLPGCAFGEYQDILGVAGLPARVRHEAAFLPWYFCVVPETGRDSHVLEPVQVFIVHGRFLRDELGQEAAGLQDPDLLVEIVLRILEQLIACEVPVPAFQGVVQPVRVVRDDGVHGFVPQEIQAPAVRADQDAGRDSRAVVRFEDLDGCIDAAADACEDVLLHGLVDAAADGIRRDVRYGPVGAVQVEGLVLEVLREPFCYTFILLHVISSVGLSAVKIFLFDYKTVCPIKFAYHINKNPVNFRCSILHKNPRHTYARGFSLSYQFHFFYIPHSAGRRRYRFDDARLQQAHPERVAVTQWNNDTGSILFRIQYRITDPV